MNFFKKPYRWAVTYTLLLSLLTGGILLKAFVLPEAQTVVVSTKDTQQSTAISDSGTATATTESSTTDPVITADSYTDSGMSIKLTEERVADTTVHLVDIQVTDPQRLRTAFAQNTYGRNIKETTSAIAEENQAILAINGDFYGFRSSGFVLRNGEIYRDTANGDTEALAIDAAGDFSILPEASTQLSDQQDLEQVLSFGPALVTNSQLSVTEGEEVGQSMNSNPRTAIGQLGEGHYLIVVSDGRTDDSVGLSLYQLAQVFEEKGATTAYNLDGGGSSTLYFNGKVINQTVGGAANDQERSVSDILYFK